MSTNATLFRVSSTEGPALDPLLHLSAEIGANSLLVQASGGNTSAKIDGTLWIKASGKWLASATRSEILVPVDLSKARACLIQGRPLDQFAVNHPARKPGLRPSIETLMHIALPHPVIAHVHSVNAIAWAIRVDAPAQLAERLSGIRWQWIPYVPSGLPLAQAVAASPANEVFVLANHGLVVCGGSCHEVKTLLQDVEHRLAIPPRSAREPKLPVLEKAHRLTDWPISSSIRIHSLATDPLAHRIAKNGILYPCQAIFLGRSFPRFSCSQPLSILRSDAFNCNPFLAIEDCGVLLSPTITDAEYAILEGFAEVLARTSGAVPIRYLTSREIEDALGAESLQYRSSSDHGPNRC
jgi:rhamnose utilization protein RhaD (predicted bifunctional aldolase and dehydrogenase)